MAKRKTQEQFEKEIHDKYPHIMIRGKYEGSNKKINVHCNIDEYDWDVLPHNLNAYGCPVCNGRIITTQSFKNELAKLHPDIEVLGEWKGIKVTIECHCKKCDLKWSYEPQSIRKTGCPRCNGSQTRKKTTDEYKAEIYNLFNGTVDVVEDYISARKKILHKCLIHNIEYKMEPSHALRGQQCPYCADEKRIKNTTKPLNKFLEELHEVKGSEYEYVSGYVNSSTNAVFKHIMSNGISHNFVMTPNSILSEYNCPCCAGYQIATGFNDFNTRHPEYTKWLVNKEDGDTHAQSSREVVDWECPCCHYRMRKSFSLVHTNGITCPCCDDGYSYPNKFMFNLLLQINDKLDFLEREYKPDWCTFTIDSKECFGRYDIYFGINNKKYIVELDGGLGHGNRTYTNSNKDKDELVLRDIEKDRLANEHNIDVIRIDCDYGTNDRYEYIKNNITRSRLSEIIDLSLLDFNSANISSLESLLIKAVECWNKEMTIFDISKEINVHECTVTNYLKKPKNMEYVILIQKKKADIGQ